MLDIKGVSMVGQKAPDFSAKAVMPSGSILHDFNLYHETEGKRIVLFFYPLDFTFVCPTEILSFAHNVEEFRKRDTEVIGISVDSVFSHQAWRDMPLNTGGIGEISIPLISDMDRKISSDYGVLLSTSPVALRATIIIDQQCIIRHISINDLALGRNVAEVLRLIDAIKHTEEFGNLCPAGWSSGKDSITPTKDGISDYLTSHASDL